LVLLRSCALAAAAACAVGAQELRPNLPAIPTYEVHRAASRIVMDGRADDAAWQKAAQVAFQFPWEQQTGAKQKTTARMLWDEQYLYVFYDCEDSDIVALHADRDDPTYKDDAVEIFINPDPKQDYYYGLEINARGVVYDYLYVFPRLLIKRLDFQGLQVASYLRGTVNARGDTDTGWTLELAIPWRNFVELREPSPPKPGETWTVNLNRWDGVEPARRLSLWSDSGLVRPHPHNPARFGRVVFVE
jgi:hypothetical protein